MIVFETPRLIVRHFRDDDLDALYAITGDAEAMRYVGNNQPISRTKTQEWIALCREHYRTRGYGCSAVIDKRGGAFVGYAGLIHPPGSVYAELIYAFAKPYWGQGLGGEVARAMVEYGFQQWALPRIEATVDPDNPASIRILERLGMALERVGVDEFNLPTAYYALENPALDS